MRLLVLDGNGQFSLTKDLIDDIPPYAILSHTWGGDEEEITFRDLVNTSGKTRTGYRKIQFCGEQAARDGLRYFWIDMCCINKSNNTELSEAINSMFRWYQNAAKCYVYLSDVSTGGRFLSSQTLWESAFRQSRWFTRGWTLQELIAPPSVEFFSRDDERLGDKKSLEFVIHEITGIPIRALQGSPLSDFTVTERMSWAAHRETKRKEDKAYSLLGIFNIHMPPIYGEGGENAFSRLMEGVKRANLLSPPPSRQIYLPLKDSGFRLLTLFPGSESTIAGNIQEYDLLLSPEYNALSYVWGTEPAILTIDLNSKPTLIRSNLFLALQRMRSRTHAIRLWVDSLCINQSDEVERSVQVSQMADIFQNAKMVWVWLGEEDLTSKTAMRFIPEMIGHDFKWDDWWVDHKFAAFDHILARPWFRRRWVIQEVAFSANTILFCGDCKVPMNDFFCAVSLVRTKLSSMTQNFNSSGKNTSRKKFLANFRDSPATRLLDIINDALHRSNEGIITRRLSLEILVDLAMFCETTDQRDTIFALLSLANDVESSSQPYSEDSIVPSYNSNLLDIFTRFILHCCRRSGSLDIICRPWAPVSSAMYTRSQIDEINRIVQSDTPSWIATRDVFQYDNSSWNMTSRLHGKPLVGHSQKRVYSAHYGTKPKVRIGKKKNTNTCDGSLYVKGIVLGEITERSTRMADALIARECLDILTAGSYEESNSVNLPDVLWRTLCADRDIRGEYAPGKYRSAMLQLLRRGSTALTNGNHPNQLVSVSSIDVEELLETELPEDVEDFLEVTRDVVWNRRTFQGKSNDGNENPIVGLIPRYAEVGDQLCILYGCSVPIVLRKYSVHNDQHYWQLIGEAYIHKFMDGEGISSMSSAMLESAEVEFEIR